MLRRHPAYKVRQGRLSLIYGIHDIGICRQNDMRVALINMEFMTPNLMSTLTVAFWLIARLLLNAIFQQVDQPNFLRMSHDHLRTGWFGLPSMVNISFMMSAPFVGIG